MPNRVRILTVPDADRAKLERRARAAGSPAPGCGAGPDRAAGRGRADRPADRRAGRVHRADGDQVAAAVRRGRPGRAGRRAAAGRAAEGADRAGDRRDPVRDGDTAAGGPAGSRGDALVDPGGWRTGCAGPGRSRSATTRITRLWRRFCLQPHRSEGFKFSTDPLLDAKVRDVVGLYLHPPENAVVVCVDEKSQCQALERSQPILPMRSGIPERQTHDYARHGVTCLFAALEVATGQVTDACYPRHRHQEFLRFLKKTAAAYPGTELHVVCDNYATHKHADVRKWLARPKNQRITLHFTPTGCSWLNLVECFFSVITRQAIRRGSFTSVRQLTATIGAFIDSWNDHPHPFAWTKDADKILASINRAKTKTSVLTDH